MKKLSPIILSVIFGSVCAVALFNKVEMTTLIDQDKNAVGVELGVFYSKEEAENLKNRLGGFVYKDKDLYRVYYAILSKDENIEYIINNLQKSNISYYLKPLKIDNKIKEECIEYENIMSSIEDSKKNMINDKIINIYERSDTFANAT